MVSYFEIRNFSLTIWKEPMKQYFTDLFSMNVECLDDCNVVAKGTAAKEML